MIALSRKDYGRISTSVEGLRDYFRRVNEIRKWISEISGGADAGSDGGPNPYYGVCPDTGDIFPSPGVGLIEYYGMPSSLSTPLGLWRIGSGTVVDETWRKIVKERLKLTPCWGQNRGPNSGWEEKFGPMINDNGEFGPVWGIGQDLSGQPFGPFGIDAVCGMTGIVTPMNLPYQAAKDLWNQVKPEGC